MSGLALFDLDAAAEGSEGENHNTQIGQQQASNEKRTLDLGPFDEEDEIERLKTIGNEEDGEMLKKKSKKKRRVFNAEMLTGGAGLERIYEGFPSTCSLEGNERVALATLVSKYKAWAFHLYPNLAFHDLLSRCETLGTKAHVRGYLEILRERERNRYLRDTLGVPAEDIVMNISSVTAGPEDSFGATSPEASDSPAPWERQSETNGVKYAGDSDEEEADFEVDWAAIEAVENSHTAPSESAGPSSEDHKVVEAYLEQRGEDGGMDESNYEDEMEVMAEIEALDREGTTKAFPGQISEDGNQKRKDNSVGERKGHHTE